VNYKLFASIKRVGVIGGSIHKFKNKNCENIYYRIFFNKNDTIRLCKAIYYDGCEMKLERKFKKFQNIIRRIKCA